MKSKITIFGLPVIGVLSIVLLLSACGATFTPAQQSAISSTANAIQSQLPPQYQPYMQAAQVLFAAYQGLTIPNSAIKTGNAKVDKVIQAANTLAPVVAGDVKLLNSLTPNPAGYVAPTAPAIGS